MSLYDGAVCSDRSTHGTSFFMRGFKGEISLSLRVSTYKPSNDQCSCLYVQEGFIKVKSPLSV